MVNRTAAATWSSLAWSILRLCEIAECRYKLWGMTVAPIMPREPASGVIPLTAGLVWRTSLVGTKDARMADQVGFDKAT